jgi:MFS family permease
MKDSGGEFPPSPKISEATRNLLFDIGFSLVEAFGALEVTAVIVANARITETLGLREELSSYIINSYLYPLFSVMALILVLSRWIGLRFSPKPFFLAGLCLFAVGNIVCFLAPSPAAFFAGRVLMGCGGAVSFAGQLWTVSVFHRLRITRTLVWGEVGAALGVVAGPLVGAIFAQFSPEGWRNFFLLNGLLALATALFAHFGIWKPPAPADADGKAGTEEVDRRRTTRVMTAWQVAVSILIVGTEYFFSDYLQAKMGKSPLFVGGMTMLASVGAILGSLWASRMKEGLVRIPGLSVSGFLSSLGVLAVCLSAGAFGLAGIPIFAAGTCMGLASVSIYTVIVHSSSPDQFLPHSMVYLLGMQVGNALGVQAVGIAEWWHLDIFTTAGLVAALPLAITLGVFWHARMAC